MQKSFLNPRTSSLSLIVCLILISLLSACSLPGSNTTATATGTTPTPAGSSSATAVGNNTLNPTIKLGTQPCPAAVSAPSHWDPIVGTQNGVSAVARVSCANLIGRSTLQALIMVGYQGTGMIIDAYVYTDITNPSPKQLFKLQGLYKGDVRISTYNTILTAEVDQNSSLNKNVGSNAGLTPDLFREFKWSDGAGTLVPVSFPGIFPDLTRYQAELDQQQVNQGHDPWKLDAAKVANTLAVTLLQWSSNASTTVVSGGGKSDVNAVVNVKSTSTVAGTIKVSLSRLEGNTNGGIWEATDVATNGMSITSPQVRDRLSSPVAVTGQGNAFEGVIGPVIVLDHLYTDIGHVTAKGATGNGNTTFSTTVSYTASFKGGAQEGILVLYSHSNADGSIIGAVMLKELLSA